MCRDKSCLIVTEAKKEELGVQIKSKITEKNIQELVIAFMDDIDFNTAGEDYQTKMRKILDIYYKYYTAIGDFIEDKKTFCFCWRSKWKKGIKVIKNKLIEL